MVKRVEIRQSVMAADERHARAIRKEMGRRSIVMLNLIGSPGAGKTTLLEATLRKASFRCAVIEGDVATSRDAERIAAAGAPVVQINTKGGCHLEAHLVAKALESLPLDEIDVLFVENVGNLVCPAEFDLGEDGKIAVSSVPEGADKPLKYPHLFHQALAVILTKADLKPHVAFDDALFWNDVTGLNPKAPRLEVASTRGEGIGDWISLVEMWLRSKGEGR
ncbi:MAG: hydrogenase nickel incorporation protein HypB [Synergistaceae bacterium]|nr:hydrogenase nickel incorporation protein HypB [Synergistaceae bacterium]